MLPSSRKTEVCWLPTSMLPSSEATGLWLTRSATPTGSRCIQAPVQQPLLSLHELGMHPTARPGSLADLKVTQGRPMEAAHPTC